MSLHIPEADVIRSQMAKAALANVINQLKDIPDSVLVQSKDKTVRIKISDGMQKDCDACGKEKGKDGGIVDVYWGDGQQETNILCKICAKKTLRHMNRSKAVEASDHVSQSNGNN